MRSIKSALGVLFAAFGEHGLAARLEPHALATFETGARYQLIHALAMGLAALAARDTARVWAQRAALLFFIGVLLFSGSLYGLALSGIRNWPSAFASASREALPTPRPCC